MNDDFLTPRERLVIGIGTAVGGGLVAFALLYGVYVLLAN
jgi:hypothetical protein